MDILKRAKSGGETVVWNESEANVREEVNRRSYKAGYTDSDGQQKISRSGAGKGDVPRSCNKKKYDKGYVKAFGHD